eukprot:2515905-Prymnesium_polylepis.1
MCIEGRRAVRRRSVRRGQLRACARVGLCWLAQHGRTAAARLRGCVHAAACSCLQPPVCERVDVACACGVWM